MIVVTKALIASGTYDGDDGGNESHDGAAADISRRAADKRLDASDALLDARNVDAENRRCAVSEVGIVGQ